MDAERPSPEDSQHQEVIEAYQRQGRWILPGFLALVILIGLGVIYFRPAYRWMKERRGDALAAEARAAMEAGEYERAMTRIRTAVQFAPKRLTVARITAEMCDLYGLPEALGYWQTVVADPSATRLDRQRFVTSALNLGREDLAQKELAELVKEDEADLENIRLSIRFLRQRGDVEAAIVVARRGTILHPTNSAPKLALASLMAGHPLPSYRDEGRGLLRELARSESPVQIEALKTLAVDKSLTREEKASIADQLERLKNPPVDSMLSLLTLRLELAPASRGALVTRTTELAVQRTNSAEVALCLKWLYENGASDRLLEAMPLTRARKDQGWIFWHCTALGGVGRWDDLVLLLEDKELPLMQYRRFGLLASAAHAQGNSEAARNHLDSAIGYARGLPEELQRLAKLSEQMGDHNMAMRAWVELLELPSLAKAAALQVLRLSQMGDRPDLVILATRRLLSLNPNDLLALNELAYTLFLEGRRDPEIEKQFLEAAQQPDSQPGLRITLALFYLQDNRASEALDVLEGQGLNLERAPSRWRMVHALVLAANQQREAAKRIFAGLNTDRLKTAEKNLVSRWL
jgi:tetratricopeptide (TPR) repeat protein